MARIFLSYSSDQRMLAERIVISLRGDGHQVFLDRETLPASAASWLRPDPRAGGLASAATLPCDDGEVRLAPVASFEANAWGLYDVQVNERNDAPRTYQRKSVGFRLVRGEP